MVKTDSYDSPDLIGVIDRVYVQPLGEYLMDRHGAERYAEIADKFNGLERDNVIVKATIAGSTVEGFFVIPQLTGWNQSNLKGFMQVNSLPAVDTEVQKDLDKWVGMPAQGVLVKSGEGTFLRLAK